MIIFFVLVIIILSIILIYKISELFTPSPNKFSGKINSLNNPKIMNYRGETAMVDKSRFAPPSHILRVQARAPAARPVRDNWFSLRATFPPLPPHTFHQLHLNRPIIPFLPIGFVSLFVRSLAHSLTLPLARSHLLFHSSPRLSLSFASVFTSATFWTNCHLRFRCQRWQSPAFLCLCRRQLTVTALYSFVFFIFQRF